MNIKTGLFYIKTAEDDDEALQPIGLFVIAETFQIRHHFMPLDEFVLLGCRIGKDTVLEHCAIINYNLSNDIGNILF